MRTITLELLRHGPAHNQLLSPLTPYLALCEDHEAVTLQVKLEHRSLLHQLRALSYQLGEETRAHEVQDSGRFMADLLAQVPGLAAELNRSGSDGPLHLRLVLSASELALLPFELALAPPTWPGAGQPMLLQPQQPMCITRESRRVAGPGLAWPTDTRLLVVLASPGGLPAVPDLAHLVALRGCLAPWIGSAAERDQHLTVLTDASLLDVQRACARTDFSHVHILAHGGERQEGADTRYGLMLHDAADPGGPADVVSGERLASALRPVRRASRGDATIRATPGAAHCPAVVTLASCNSGAVGGVTGLGASIAHALHQAGIPLVIASQFPLSFGGSVRMVQTLYDGLLWGEDPRAVLVDLRRQLHTEFPGTADWASLTAYASLPPDFEAALADSQVQRAMTAINSAMKAVEAAVLDAKQPAPAAAEAAIGAALGQLQRAGARLRLPAETIAPTPQQRARRLRVLKLQASTAKREAGLSQVQAERSARAGDAAAQARHLAAMWRQLTQSRGLYFDCWHEERTPYFTTQYLSLDVLQRWAGRAAADQDEPGRDPAQLWDLAEVQALHDARQAVPQERIWAHGTLAELYLLALAIPGIAQRARDWQALAVSEARQLVAGVAGNKFQLLSTRRQFQRYGQWYARLCVQPPAWQGQLLAIAQAVVDELPALHDAEWDYARG